MKEETQLGEKRLPVMARYKQDPKLLKAQREALIEFDKFNVARDLTIPSRFNYMKTLRLLGLVIRKPYKKINYKDMIDYYSRLRRWDTEKQEFTDKPVSKETKWSYQTTHIVFFNWLGKKELAEKIKDIRVKKSKNGKVRREDVLTPSEISKIISACKHKRDKLLIGLLYECNARRGEIIGLKIKDVSFDEYGAQIKIRKGKTEDSVRTVPVIDFAPLLKDYVENEHPTKEEDDYLFTNLISQEYRGVEGYKRLGVDNAILILKNAAKRAGLKKSVYPHLLRHSRTTNLLIDGVPTPIVQQLGGWADIQQLAHRYGHVTAGDARKFFLKQRGIIKEGKDRDSSLDIRVCPRCSEKNQPTNKYCSKCWLVLDVKEALSQREEESKIVRFLRFAEKEIPEEKLKEFMSKFS